MKTMQALVARERGGPERLHVETVPVPTANPDEVLVEVHAAAITFAELSWDETWTHIPTVPSHEVSGVVVARGASVQDVEVGAEVFGLIAFDRPGAAAEYATIPASDLALRPPSVSHVVAAAVPLAGLTAWQALHDQAALEPGERVLVLGGTGGVGAFAVQLASHAGARVTASVLGDASVPIARGLGADEVIDVATNGLDAAAPGFDVVLDTVGGDTLARAYALVRPGGRLVTLQAPPSKEEAYRHGITATFFIVRPDHAQLGRLASLVDSGALQVTIAATFDLADGRAAFESGRTWDRPPGKTVLVVRP